MEIKMDKREGQIHYYSEYTVRLVSKTKCTVSKMYTKQKYTYTTAHSADIH